VAVLAIAAQVMLLAGPAAAATDKPIELKKASGEVADNHLLDVAVVLFDPGVPEGKTEEQLEKSSIFPSVRKTEARFVALQLRSAMQGSGYWGAVRVVGTPAEGAELTVTGRIVNAGGKHLVLDIKAEDATGKEWLERRYEGTADKRAYHPTTGAPAQEPFQALYNRIANDLSAMVQRQDVKTIARIRDVARLRFARQLAPRAFDDYLKTEHDHVTLRRLPAADDPMAKRVDALRERDGMLVDTLDEHYATFADRIQGSYNEWRKSSYEEQDMLDRANHSAKIKGLLGVAAILGAVVLGASHMCDPRYDDCSSGDAAATAASEVAVLAGTLAVQSAIKSHGEAKMHAAALREMAVSLDAEVQPVLVEVEGRTKTLEGNAETQFTAWRALLSEIFTADTGTPPAEPRSNR
jgi:hypothetical protein